MKCIKDENQKIYVYEGANKERKVFFEVNEVGKKVLCWGILATLKKIGITWSIGCICSNGISKY